LSQSDNIEKIFSKLTTGLAGAKLKDNPIKINQTIETQ